MKKITFWVGMGILVSVMVVSGYLINKIGNTKNSLVTKKPVVVEASPEETSSEVNLNAREILVKGDEYSFMPSVININKGEKIKLTFENVGTLPHDLIIESLGVGTKEVLPGESESFVFTAKEEGEIEFFCSIGSHRSLGMEGTLEVK
jgi:plastocyanin